MYFKPNTGFDVAYLLNQLADFDQSYIDTLLGGGKELIIFWVILTLFSKSHQHFEM